MARGRPKRNADNEIDSYFGIAAKVPMSTRIFFAQIVTITFKPKVLAQIRDLLLPKLMSCEIHLRDAEKIVEAVA